MILIEKSVKKKREKMMTKLTIVIFATLFNYTFIIYHCFKSDI